MTFTGTGTYTVDQSYSASGGTCTTHDVISLTWTATFKTTVEDGVLQPAPGSYASGSKPDPMDFTISGICTYMNTVPPCSTSVASSSAASPNMSVSGTDPQQLRAQSVPGSLIASFCQPTDGPFMGRDLYFLNQSLPDSTTAVANIAKSALSSGAFSTNVTDANAAGQVISNCTGLGPGASSNTSCSASLHWSGTLAVAQRVCPGPKITEVDIVHEDGTSQQLTQSERASYGIPDDSLHPGQQISTPDGVTLLIGFNDNNPGQSDASIWKIGANAEVNVDANCDNPNVDPNGFTIGLVRDNGATDHYFQWGPNAFSDGVDWVMTSLEAHAAFPCNCSRGAADAAAAPGYRPAFTISRLKTGDTIFHLIRGTVTLTLGTAKLRLTAGGGALLTQHGVIKPSSQWPASALRLVPATMRPPKLSALSVTGATAGQHAIVRLRLDQPAALTVSVLRGKHRIAQKVAAGHRGKNQISLPKLRKGLYSLQISAQSKGRVSILIAKLRIG